MSKVFYLVAGESSGDILGARLIAALKQIYPNATFHGIGGELMMQQGLCLLYPMERLSIMGIVPILKRLPELLRMRAQLAEQIVQASPDCFIGIDAPVFNTGLEYRLKNKGITTVHYVSPSVWAWRENRIYKIAKSVSLMLCLFPFELDIYKRHKVPAVCIGHPLANELPMEPNVTAAREKFNLPSDELVIALLPGSRGTEIGYLLEPFLNCARILLKKYPTIQFVLPCANQKRRQQIELQLNRFDDLPIHLFDGQSREVMLSADVVLLASGTATLEAMLLKKPMIVAYKMSKISFWIFNKLLKINQFSLPNLLAGKPLVKEMMQENCRADLLAKALIQLIETRHDSQIIKQFYQIHESLKLGGSDKAAHAIVELMEQQYVK